MAERFSYNQYTESNNGNHGNYGNHGDHVARAMFTCIEPCLPNTIIKQDVILHTQHYKNRLYNIPLRVARQV